MSRVLPSFVESSSGSGSEEEAKKSAAKQEKDEEEEEYNTLSAIIDDAQSGKRKLSFFLLRCRLVLNEALALLGWYSW